MTYRYRKKPSNRQLRVSDEIAKEVSSIIVSSEVDTSPISTGAITVISARTSPDLKIATIFIKLFQLDDGKNASIDLALKVLNSQSNIFRKLICKRVYLKFSPEIRFAEALDYQLLAPL